MRKPRDGHKRQDQDNLEKLKVGKLTVLTFFPSEIFVRNPHPLKEGHKLGIATTARNNGYYEEGTIATTRGSKKAVGNPSKRGAVSY